MKPKFDIHKGNIYKFTLIDKSKPEGKQKKDLYFFAQDTDIVPMDFFKSAYALNDPLLDPTTFLNSSGLIPITIDDIVNESIEVVKNNKADKLIERGVFELKNPLWK
jgi:hypothetical protein